MSKYLLCLSREQFIKKSQVSKLERRWWVLRRVFYDHPTLNTLQPYNGSLSNNLMWLNQSLNAICQRRPWKVFLVETWYLSWWIWILFLNQMLHATLPCIVILKKNKLGHKNLDENTSLTMFAFLYKKIRKRLYRLVYIPPYNNPSEKKPLWRST